MLIQANHLLLFYHFLCHYIFFCSNIIHSPSLSLPVCFKMLLFCKAERSRSIVRELTDKVSDIRLAVIDGDCLMRLMIFC